MSSDIGTRPTYPPPENIDFDSPSRHSTDADGMKLFAKRGWDQLARQDGFIRVTLGCAAILTTMFLAAVAWGF